MRLVSHQGYVPQELYIARIEDVRRVDNCYYELTLSDGVHYRWPLDPYTNGERPRIGEWLVQHPLSTRGYNHATAEYGLTLFTIEPRRWQPTPLKVIP